MTLCVLPSEAAHAHDLSGILVLSPDVIWYEAKLDDPKNFTRPWKIRMPPYRLPGEESQLLDFKCVE